MDSDNNREQIIYTNKARCRDCYRCVRVCPVKSIMLKGNQAFVEAQRCILCGTCIRECPQKAKSFRNDLENAKKLVEGQKVAVSIAPSFAGLFTEWEQKRLPSALRKIGFAHIAETAVGAYYVAKKTADIISADKNRPYICTSCPAVVNYIEKYMVDYIDLLTPVVSPMIAHAEYIKNKLGKHTKMVFIGPCVAKKGEAEREENDRLVDCTLTFNELIQWFEDEKIDLSTLEESEFDDSCNSDAYLFPIEGGLLKTASLNTGRFENNIISLTGFEQVQEILECINNMSGFFVIEPLLCSNGCINGPGFPDKKNLFERRKGIIDYAESRKRKTDTLPQECSNLSLEAKFTPQPVDKGIKITEDEIRLVLEKTGKASDEDQLNCGACGYSSCRNKAIAVIKGMAEVEMCIPYMRKLAEQRMDKIIETSPNGIVILNEHLNIIGMNPAFRKLFYCSENIFGKSISNLMDPENFLNLLSGKEEKIENVVFHKEYSLTCHQILYRLKDEQQVVGIFIDITKSRLDQKQLECLKTKTVNQARDLYEHQIETARKFAQFLGEYTAKGEKLVNNLMQLIDVSENDLNKKTD